ncbi:MAG: GTP pyrophosphokinase [Clostridia bacterium]|nr:GTP pyrophosphokinase [Clostridia bacterium]
MYYSELVKKACRIMFEAHQEDTDKGGYPYVFHPFFLATQMDDEASTCVALLHDVVEDHGDRFDFAFLKKEGFPDPVINALRLLTHAEDLPYMEYVGAIGKDPIARKVKMADLRHNLDVRRNGGTKPKKYDLYLQALSFLEEAETAGNERFPDSD